jgi:hypothetical protein
MVLGGVMRTLRKYSDISKELLPTTDDAYVGIEIECLIPMERKDIQKKLFRSKVRRYVSFKNDGSLEYGGKCHCHDKINSHKGTKCKPCYAYDMGCYCEDCLSYRNKLEDKFYPGEVCVLVKESEIKRVIPQVCGLLKSMGAFTNNTCGLHVHVDARNRNPSELYAKFVARQSILFALSGKERQNNRYCRRTKSFSLIDSSDERRKGVNGQAFDEHQTIEIRTHKGTLNHEEIIQWCNLLVDIAGPANKVSIETKSKSIKSTLSEIKSSELRSYVKDKIKKNKKVA